MDVKDYIKKRRIELAMSQYDLADRLSHLGQETSYTRISHWETGRNKPPLHKPDFRRALALALEIDVNTMLGNMGYVLWDDDRTEEAKRAAEIIDVLPPEARDLAIDYLEVLLRRFSPV